MRSNVASGVGASEVSASTVGATGASASTVGATAFAMWLGHSQVRMAKACQCTDCRDAQESENALHKLASFQGVLRLRCRCIVVRRNCDGSLRDLVDTSAAKSSTLVHCQ